MGYLPPSMFPSTLMARQYNVRQPSSLPGKLLATGTEVRAALSDDDTLNCRAATHTGFAFLMVDLDMIVVVARLAPEVAVIIERCSAMLNTLSKY